MIALTRGFQNCCMVLIMAGGCAFAQTAAGPATGSDQAPKATASPQEQAPPPSDAADQNLDIPVSSPKVAVEQPPGALKTLFISTVKDQKVMWTSPFHMNRSNYGWWLGFGLATGGLVAADRTLSRQLPNTSDQTAISRDISQTGAVYTLYPITGVYYLIGVLADSPKTKEVGALGAEALTNALIISSVIKVVTGRERPEAPNGNGNWGQWGNYSFPSGHSIMGWALASLVAHEYHNTPAIPIICYTLATGVSAARFSARKHWASDIVAGGAMGWFIGRYVYRRHADPRIHQAPISRLIRPDSIGPYFNPRTGGVGIGLTWNLGSSY